MATYCISDIHGEYDRYMAMLDLINFSDTDTLFVLGDVIDRRPSGVDVLLDIMSRSNVRMILGNHEDMCLKTLDATHVVGARQLWQSNGGSPTRRELLYIRTAEERLKILRFIRDLPDHLDIEVNGKAFHLVHGMPGNTREIRIWDRPEPAPQNLRFPELQRSLVTPLPSG